MMSLLVQLFSNEESANILPVPWFALHRCRFHGIGRLGITITSTYALVTMVLILAFMR
jgi:hypothetical protein